MEIFLLSKVLHLADTNQVESFVKFFKQLA